jgi:hypothetical protein
MPAAGIVNGTVPTVVDGNTNVSHSTRSHRR